MKSRRKRPSPLHLVVPFLYAYTGTCYCFSGHVVPMVAAVIYYTLAIVHTIIYIIEQNDETSSRPGQGEQ